MERGGELNATETHRPDRRALLWPVARVVLAGAVLVAIIRLVGRDLDSRASTFYEAALVAAVIGAGLFCVAIPPLMYHLYSAVPGEDRRRFRSAMIFGASFLVWGLLLAPLFGGFFGVLYGLVCALFFGISCRSLALGLAAFFSAPLAVLSGAATANIGISNSLDTPWTSLLVEAVVAWNVLITVTTALWVARAKRRLALQGPSCCGECNYDLTGLADDAPCPECGAIRPPPPDVS